VHRLAASSMHTLPRFPAPWQLRHFGSRIETTAYWSLLAAESVINLPGIEVFENRAELVVIEDLLEDRFVVVHARDDGVYESFVEDESEVVEVVVSGLCGSVGLAHCRRVSFAASCANAVEAAHLQRLPTR
jgi:hypothetical protein